ncbi:MerR family transcriptional regulator [Roseateles sp. NT4]|uniref:MerR family transcriptional regulator n=1 Tax=Roseateles sp. NT4 TaxID=3453715 RepID=UPI003EF0536B
MTDPASGIGIAAVERDTGIHKETLRVWERRYGFPSPQRDASGERLYPPEQVQRLRLLKRLLDAGHRPGRVVPAPAQELSVLLQPPVPPDPGAAPQAPEIAACVALLQVHDAAGLRNALSQALLRRGLSGAVLEVFAPLTVRVGELWMGGRLQVFQAHLFGEALQTVLRQALHTLPCAQGRQPRALLTTLPGEGHALGLLMVEALLGLEGAVCLPLGPQTPLTQLPVAAQAYQADVVVLSFSGQLPQRAVLDGLSSLRTQLPATVEIWASSSSRALRLPGCPEGVRCLDGLAAIAAEMTRCRELLECRL